MMNHETSPASEKLEQKPEESALKTEKTLPEKENSDEVSDKIHKSPLAKENKGDLSEKNPKPSTKELPAQRSAEGRIRKAVKAEYESEIESLKAYKERTEGYFAQKWGAKIAEWQQKYGKDGQKLIESTKTLSIQQQIDIFEALDSQWAPRHTPSPLQNQKPALDPYQKYRNRS